ncbi:MAG: protein kinase [Myxococcota bacterium]
MAELSPGTVLDERFEILGVVGRGGTATVYLATDRIRDHRIALKIVHPHLASDPGVRRRMRSEVQAATVVRHPGALVPYELHSLEQGLALALPFHPGQTLSERVATSGPLSADEVRALGLRVATVLSTAHRAGVLHRDITANNVLLGSDPSQAVLTDFGLARVTQLQRSRTTGLLGTAGYAAPEVYAGERADPRSDLYGLGAILYLAATGRPAFDPAHPMGGLQQQLDEAWTPISELRPDLPPDLAQTIEALLRRDPDDRPQGPREVCDALEGKIPAKTPQAIENAGPSATEMARYLPPGSWTVVVHETDDDTSRRKQLRIDGRKARATAESELIRWGKQLAQTVRGALGLESAAAPTPEELLAGAIAEEAGLEPSAVAVHPNVLATKFRLIDDTDEATARRLARAATDVGFKARAMPITGESDLVGTLAKYFWVPIAVGWSSFPFIVSEFGANLVLPILIGISIILPIVGKLLSQRSTGTHDIPVAYTGDLKRTLAEGSHALPRFSAEASPDPATPARPQRPPSKPAAEPPRTRGQSLGHRASLALKGLSSAVESRSEDLPDSAIYDLRATVGDLQKRAQTLADDVDRMHAALDGHGAPETDVTWMRDRLDRIRTLERAGETVDATEVQRLDAAMAQHSADVDAAAHVEAQLTSASAQLLEIASTASRVRRELLTQAVPARSADHLVQRLRNEALAADAARKEAESARKQARARHEASKQGR